MKARKKRYKEYRQQIISSLDSLHDNNPKAYWSLLEKLKKDNKDGNINPISDDTWYNYFKDLNISKTTRFHNSSVDAELSVLEKLYILTDLNYKISAIEIYSAIGSSKNKSCGGVVGWCEGAVYLTSLGRPTDIGLQLGKACYPCG